MMHVVLKGVLLVAVVLAPGAVRAQQADTVTGPDTVVFTPERGTVTFTHRAHAKPEGCVDCHHPSKAERPDTLKYQKCSACHTAEAVAPMKTTRRNAFHDTESRSGVCFDCHKKVNDEGKSSPVKCNDCHKRGEGASAGGVWRTVAAHGPVGRRAGAPAGGLMWAGTARHRG